MKRDQALFTCFPLNAFFFCSAALLAPECRVEGHKERDNYYYIGSGPDSSLYNPGVYSTFVLTPIVESPSVEGDGFHFTKTHLVTVIITVGLMGLAVGALA